MLGGGQYNRYQESPSLLFYFPKDKVTIIAYNFTEIIRFFFVRPTQNFRGAPRGDTFFEMTALITA